MPKPRKDDLGSAEAAYLRGLQGGPEALFWLRRARRLAPEDPRIELEIAHRQLAAGPEAIREAFATFEALARQYDITPAWIGMAIAAQRLNDAAAAARAVDQLLSRHCLPADPGFPPFVRHVALTAGYGGYQGEAEDGTRQSEGAGRLLGARPDEAALARVEGVASWEKDGVSGWAVRPASPGRPPPLTLTDAEGRRLPIACGASLPNDETSPFLPRYRFRLSAARLAGLAPPFRIAGADGRDLLGSPLDPRPLAAPPVAAGTRGAPPAALPAPAPLALLMPVYRGLAETRAAIASALEAKPSEARFIVVDDASPEPDLAAWLADQAGKGRFELIRHPRNLGFCAACNTGFAAAPGCDVLLLNSDILLPAPAVETLRRVAYASPATGTVTPLANDATICAYPAPNTANPMPDLREATRLNRLAAKTNGLAWVEIPTGIGFCLYIRHDCLAAVGGFRAEIFAQGYGEENDFCLRARQRGFLHAAAMGAYVAHKGGVSFRSAARALVRRNLALLNRLYPGYTALIAAHNAADPAAPHRAALDAARLLAERRGRPAVLLISHAHGGGVATRVRAVMAQLRAQGCYPLLLTARRPAAPERTPYPWPSLLCAGDPEEHPNLVFTLPGGLPRLLALLRRLKVTRVELHHALGQHAAVRGLAAALGVPQDIVAHDYASFCPRVNLLARPAPEAPPRYCGEPDPKGCARCCAWDKAEIAETIPIPRLLARSRQEFAAARRVITPSADMARRLARHFPGLEPEIIPWEDDSAPRPLRKPRPGARRVAVIGGIGPAKGLDVLLGCAADSRRRDLPLDFTLIGGSADDAALIAAGVKVTGPYQPGEAEALITSLAPDLAFIPSIWPETWCFVLGEAWRAGLYTVVFDLGAQAERVRATGRGAILPLGLPPERVNNSLLTITF